MDRAFLDANVLFSAAYGSTGLRTLWRLAVAGRLELLVSSHVVEEARRNLAREHIPALDELVARLEVVVQAPPSLSCPIDLPPGDREAFLSAVASRASHFLTGDLRHFGPYLGKRVAGVRIQRPGEYLRAFQRRPGRTLRR